MKTIIIGTALCIAMAACQPRLAPSKTPVANTEKVRYDTVKNLLGHCSPAMLQQLPYSQWFSTNYAAYQPHPATIAALAPQMRQLRVEIFLGTWCGDSKREVPRMLKILAQAGMDSNAISLIFVDNLAETYKQSPQHEEQGKHIFRVPTFLVYRHQKLLNRIVESPVESLEKDLLQIATGNAYTPQYPALNFWITQRGSKTKMLSQRRLSQLAAIYKPLAKNAFEFNAYASVLMAAKQWAAAENVLLINSLLYPAEPRVWQSLAALYTQTGDASKLRQCNKTLATLKPL